MSADQPFRDDQNLDRMRGELVVVNKEAALLAKENAMLKKENATLKKNGVGRSVSRVAIVSVAVAAAIYTGNGWFIALAFLAL